MSAGRRYRRALRPPITQRAGAVELGHETRHLLGEVLAAHDDPAVSTAEFVPVMAALWAHVERLPEPERLEVAGRVLARTTGGRYVGWGRPA